MSCLLVLDMNKRPLKRVHPAEARRLLTQHRAAVWRSCPVTSSPKRALRRAYAVDRERMYDDWSARLGDGGELNTLYA